MNEMTDCKRLEALGGDNCGYYGEFDSRSGSSDYDDWSDVDDDDGYYDPFQTGVEEEIVTFGSAFWMVADTVAVAAVMCSENHVDLRVSEGPGLFDNMETEPGPKSPEPGEVSHVPVLISWVLILRGPR